LWSTLQHTPNDGGNDVYRAAQAIEWLFSLRGAAMIALSLHGTESPGVKVAPSNLNMWASTAYWRGAPLIADDYYRACIGTDIRWDILALFYWLKNDFGRAMKEDVFGIGFGGSPEDTAINATLHVQSAQWQTVENLPLSADEKAVLLMLVQKWEAVSAGIVSRQTTGEPLPKPPPPPPPPKPIEEPVVLEPHDNIPSHPVEPVKKSSGWAWAKTAAAVLGGLSFIAGLFLPGWGKTILDAIIAILRALGAM
jgi:hypothetical protein